MGPPKPVVVELLVGALLTKREQHSVDLPAQGAVQLEHDGERYSVELRTDYVYPSLALMRHIIIEHRSAEDDGIHFLVQKSLKHLVRRRELLHLCVMLPKIINGCAVRYCSNLLTGQIAGPLDGAANLLDGQGRGQLLGIERNENHTSEHPEDREHARHPLTRHRLRLCRQR
jgi:hypothetical protein